MVLPFLTVLPVLLLTLQGQKLAPYAPTPPDVVDRMLALAAVSAGDVLIDLGCGDGRIAIRAAQKFGVRATGVDIDPRRIDESRANAKAAGVEPLTEFRVEDALSTDVSQASVVTLFIGSEGNTKLRPVLQRQLKPGARIVSHAFSMGPEWPPDRVDQFTSANGDTVTLYLWTIK
jgi:cyclopropane fatty-acyl-phospholipid synthase-like methyltransferase